MTDRSQPYPGAPRWAKVLGTIFGVVTLLFFVMLFTRGPHGGHAHQQQRDAAGEREQRTGPGHERGQPDQRPEG